MTQATFTRLLETLLSTAGVAYERRGLLDFVAAAWPLIEADPDPVKWAEAFAETLAREPAIAP